MLPTDIILDMYFRQYLQDPRLAYNRPNKQIILPGNVADRLWQPDTYFENSKRGELHKLTTLNKVVVVRPDGGVYFSLRYIAWLFLKYHSFCSCTLCICGDYNTKIYYKRVSGIPSGNKLIKTIRYPHMWRYRWFYWYQVCLLNCTLTRTLPI